MTLNEKTKNYKVVDLVERYNFHIKSIFIRIRMKKLWFFKIRSCHATPGVVARVCCHAGRSGVTSFPHGLCAGRSLPRSPTWHTLLRHCMWRDRVFLSRHADWRDQKGQICKYLFGWVIFKILVKKGLKIKKIFASQATAQGSEQDERKEGKDCSEDEGWKGERVSRVSTDGAPIPITKSRGRTGSHPHASSQSCKGDRRQGRVRSCGRSLLSPARTPQRVWVFGLLV